MSNNETNAATHYVDFFKKWQPAGMAKLLGPKPTAEQLACVHGLGCRPGKQALAIALSTRDCGVTGSQIQLACGAPQLVKMRGLITDAYLREMPAPMLDGLKVYRNEITPKGRQRIERAAKAQAAAVVAGEAETEKAPKVKAVKKPTSKARKARPATADKLPPVSPVDNTETGPAFEAERVHENGATADQLPAPQL